MASALGLVSAELLAGGFAVKSSVFGGGELLMGDLRALTYQ